METPFQADAKPFRLLHLQCTAIFGGDESNTLLLCRHLPKMRHFVGVYFGSGPMVGAWRDAGAEVAVLELDPADRRGLVRAVRERVAVVQPDAVYLGSVSLLPLVLKGLDGFAGEVLCHTGNPDRSSVSSRLKFWTARALLRPTTKPTMVHCSEYVRSSYARNRFYGRYRHEVAISTGLLDVEGDVAQVHQPRVVEAGDPVRLGMLARLDPIKNHRLVIRAFRLILDDYPNARLELIGDGSERANLEAEVARLELSDRVAFHGKLPDPFRVMREWDLFLYGTTAAEGFGAALAEAMALGLPCVVTDVGPMREVGGEGGAVRYVPPDSPEQLSRAAVGLLHDQGERARMAAGARLRAKEAFGGARFARRIAGLLYANVGPGNRSRVGLTVG
jgi:glycosyltransferase involved in cell wall biosynthesis